MDLVESLGRIKGALQEKQFASVQVTAKETCDPPEFRIVHAGSLVYSGSESLCLKVISGAEPGNIQSLRDAAKQ